MCVQTGALDAAKQKAKEDVARRKIERWVAAQAKKNAAERVRLLGIWKDCIVIDVTVSFVGLWVCLSGSPRAPVPVGGAAAQD